MILWRFVVLLQWPASMCTLQLANIPVPQYYIRRTNISVSSHLTMILECVVAISIVCSKIVVSASSWVLNNSWSFSYPCVFNSIYQLAIGETSCQHKSLVFLEDLWSRICQVYTDELCQCWFVCGVFDKFSVVWNPPTPITDDICRRCLSASIRRSRFSCLIYSISQ